MKTDFLKRELRDLPGTPQHQAILHAIAAYYENDPRILAVAVFGSLGRGNWDRYSDLDLDVVTADAVEIEIEAEITRLCAALASLDEHIALLIADGNDAADVVFKSRMELSIRYHPLAATSPNIIDSLQLILGRISQAAIEAAGLANQAADDEPLDWELDRCIRYALEVDSALHRGNLWSAVELLHYMRTNIMQLYTSSHHGKRAYQFFQKEADPIFQARLGGALPRYELKSAQECLLRLLDILANDLNALTEGQVHLTVAQVDLMGQVIARQKDLKL